MKNSDKKTCFFLVLVLVGLLLIPFLVLDSDAGQVWPKNKGELCWATTREGDTLPSGMARLGITNIFAGHYVVAGVATGTDSDGTPYTNIAHGNAELIGDSIKMTLLVSERDSVAFRAGISHAVLDISTLNGDQENVGWEYYRAPGTITEEFERGFLTLINCP